MYVDSGELDITSRIYLSHCFNQKWADAYRATCFGNGLVMLDRNTTTTTTATSTTSDFISMEKIVLLSPERY